MIVNVWANCDNCKHTEADKKYCSDCLATRPPSKWEPADNYLTPTNADRIRAMSDEELADVLTYHSNNGGWIAETGREICYKRIIEWLKQPAGGE